MEHALGFSALIFLTVHVAGAILGCRDGNRTGDRRRRVVLRRGRSDTGGENPGLLADAAGEVVARDEIMGAYRRSA